MAHINRIFTRSDYQKSKVFSDQILARTPLDQLLIKAISTRLMGMNGSGGKKGSEGQCMEAKVNEVMLRDVERCRGMYME